MFRWVGRAPRRKFAYLCVPNLVQGKGQLTMGQRTTTCYIGKGEGQWYCADCQATGMISRKKV